MLDTEYILTHGVFLSLLCAGQGDLSQNLWLPRICYLLFQSEREQLSQLWLLLLLLSVSFTSKWAKEKSPPLWCNSLWGDELLISSSRQLAGGGTVNCLQSPGLTRFDILLLSYLDNILRSALLPSLQGAQGNKIINSVSSISHILTRGRKPWPSEYPVLVQSGRMREHMLGASFFCSAILLWHHWVAGWWLTSSCMIQDTSVKFEDPKE